MPESAFDRPAITARTIGEYLDALGSSAPTPGGGSTAGVIGALGASLGLMVISLTSTDDEEEAAALEPAQDALTQLRGRFTDLAEADEQVFQRYRDATDMPKDTADAKQARRVAMQEALKHAASVPLRAAQASIELARALVAVQQHGNQHLLSDARIAMLCVTTCFESSRINVHVNLDLIRDEPWITDVANQLETLSAEMQDILAGGTV